jgi:uncharacterized protein involved in response to NO
MKRPDPYRLLFPIGLTYGILGAGLWPLHALGVLEYPGIAHRRLMIQGFEQCFVLGFLLTAMPGITKGPPCHPLELAVAVGTAVSFGIAVAWGAWQVSAVAFAASMGLLMVALARRLGPSRAPRPMELLFVGFGLVMGMLGSARQMVGGGIDGVADAWISLGMVLSLVLGLGSLLVPTFTGMKSPLTIPGIAAPHESGRRALLYAVLIAALASAFAFEELGRPRTGAFIRAGTATVMIILVWKLIRPPGHRDAPAFAMWSSGWFIVLGLWIVALAPPLRLGGLHVVFIGGFALLTLGIGTRVLVAHGGYPPAEERTVLSPLLVATVLLTLAARLIAEAMPSRVGLWLAISGGLWVFGWLAWAFRAMPRLAGSPKART